jgi:hypothetical protein
MFVNALRKTMKAHKIAVCRPDYEPDTCHIQIMSVNPIICSAALFHVVLYADQQFRVVKKMKMKLWC